MADMTEAHPNQRLRYFDQGGRGSQQRLRSSVKSLLQHNKEVIFLRQEIGCWDLLGWEAGQIWGEGTVRRPVGFSLLMPPSRMQTRGKATLTRCAANCEERSRGKKQWFMIIGCILYSQATPFPFLFDCSMYYVACWKCQKSTPVWLMKEYPSSSVLYLANRVGALDYVVRTGSQAFYSFLVSTPTDWIRLMDLLWVSEHTDGNWEFPFLRQSRWETWLWHRFQHEQLVKAAETKRHMQQLGWE